MKRKSLHQELIDLLVAQDPRFKAKGFRREVLARSPYAAERGVTDEEYDKFADEDGELPDDFVGSGPTTYDEHIGGIKPDVFLFDEEREFLWIAEVEVTNPLSAEKLALYRELFWIIDQDYWQIWMIFVDRNGIGRAPDFLDAVYRKEQSPDGMQYHWPTFNLRIEGDFARWFAEVNAGIRQVGVLMEPDPGPDGGAAILGSMERGG